MNFNPRSRTGSDCGKKIQLRRMGNISIHAPAQGATIIAHVYADLARDFNPRSRTGSDGHRRPHGDVPVPLSSTPPPPPGTDGSRAARWTPQSRFQPTLPHRERQPPADEGRKSKRISTHAPAQGATQPEKYCGSFVQHFNPRSRTGSDWPEHGHWAKQHRDFNPRSRTGSDRDGFP